MKVVRATVRCVVLLSALGATGYVCARPEIVEIQARRFSRPVDLLVEEVDYVVTIPGPVKIISIKDSYCVTSSMSCGNDKLSCYWVAAGQPCHVCSGSGTGKYCAPDPNDRECTLIDNNEQACGTDSVGTCTFVAADSTNHCLSTTPNSNPCSVKVCAL